MCIRKGILPGLLFLVFILPAAGQDFYDLEHTLRFSDYLFRSRQYDLAAQELERAVWMNPGNAAVKLRLIESYRLGERYELGVRAVERFFMDSLMYVPAGFGREYLRSLILAGDHGRAGYFIGNAKYLEPADRNNFSLSLLLIDKNWEEAREYAAGTVPLNMRLVDIAEESGSLRYKSAGLALFFSAIVPGSGKIYTKRWKDGLVSLLFVAANSYQAYRGFSKNGVESVHGWVFGTLAAGFYAGNLYGSWRSAKIYNNRLDDALQQKALDQFRTGF